MTVRTYECAPYGLTSAHETLSVEPRTLDIARQLWGHSALRIPHLESYFRTLVHSYTLAFPPTAFALPHERDPKRSGDELRVYPGGLAFEVKWVVLGLAVPPNYWVGAYSQDPEGGGRLITAHPGLGLLDLELSRGVVDRAIPGRRPQRAPSQETPERSRVGLAQGAGPPDSHVG